MAEEDRTAEYRKGLVRNGASSEEAGRLAKKISADEKQRCESNPNTHYYDNAGYKEPKSGEEY
jgi:hypothetical protein